MYVFHVFIENTFVNSLVIVLYLFTILVDDRVYILIM